MTTEFAIAYIPRRMRELKIGSAYSLRFRHLVIPASAEVKINAGSDFYLFISPYPGVRIQSEGGIYDRSALNVRELQYEHRGRIRIKNLSGSDSQHVLFIQVVPHHKKPLEV